MKYYWPNAIAKSDNDYEDGTRLFTYGSVKSLDQCEKQFDIWKNEYKYKLLCAWVEDDDKNLIMFREYTRTGKARRIYPKAVISDESNAD